MERRKTTTAMYSWLTVAATTLLLSATSAPLAAAQVVGVDICYCQPSDYEFTLNFDLGCADSTIETGSPGIREAICNVATAGDPFPVVVGNLLISELDELGNPIKVSNVTGDFSNGDTIEYSSILNDDFSSATVNGLLVSIAGQNAAGEMVSNAWAIFYNNTCDDYPVLVDGDQIGWVVMVRAYFGNVNQIYSIAVSIDSHSRLSVLILLLCFCAGWIDSST